MKSFVKHKLQEERGATIIMALFAFMVAALVSALILAAATSSVRQAKLDQENQQNLLILQSAGELIEKEVKNTTVTIRSTLTTEKKNNNIKSIETEWPCSVSGKASGLLKDKILKAVKETQKDATTSYSDVASSTAGSFVINTTSASEEFSQDVTVTYFLRGSELKDDNGAGSDSANQLVFTLTTNSGDSSSEEHSLVLTMFCAADYPKMSPTNGYNDGAALEKNKTYNVEKTFKWDSASYTRGGGTK